MVNAIRVASEMVEVEMVDHLTTAAASAPTDLGQRPTLTGFLRSFQARKRETGRVRLPRIACVAKWGL